MRVVVAHGPENNVREIRQVLHGAGADCTAEDCVLIEELPARLGQSECDLVVVQASEVDGVNWRTVNEAMAFTSAPIVAIGPNGRSEIEAAARQAGVQEYIPISSLRSGIDAALERFFSSGEVRCHRGQIIAVVAPSAGTGGTFLALNLAGQLAIKLGGEAGLVELAAGFGKIGLMLHEHPELTLDELSRRLHRMDRTALVRSLGREKCGLRLLLNSPERASETFLTGDVVRRLTVLSRMTNQATVLALGTCMYPMQLEALRMSDRIVMVVRPDVPSLNRAHWAFEKWTQMGITADRIALVVNFWGQSGLLPKSQIQEALPLGTPLYLLYDPGRVNRCINEGVLMQHRYPRSRVGRQIAGLAAQLAATPVTR